MDTIEVLEEKNKSITEYNVEDNSGAAFDHLETIKLSSKTRNRNF